MALAAGYVLSGLWYGTAEFMIAMTGLVPAGVVSGFVATALLILLPPIVLLFHGQAYKSLTGRLVGSFLFTLLAMAFLIAPMSKAFIVDGPSVQVFEWVAKNADLIIGVGVMAAVFDMLFSKIPVLPRKK